LIHRRSRIGPRVVHRAMHSHPQSCPHVWVEGLYSTTDGDDRHGRELGRRASGTTHVSAVGRSADYPASRPSSRVMALSVVRRGNFAGRRHQPLARGGFRVNSSCSLPATERAGTRDSEAACGRFPALCCCHVSIDAASRCQFGDQVAPSGAEADSVNRAAVNPKQLGAARPPVAVSSTALAVRQDVAREERTHK
jgi:hypothetical protein